MSLVKTISAKTGPREVIPQALVHFEAYTTMLGFAEIFLRSLTGKSDRKKFKTILAIVVAAAEAGPVSQNRLM